MNKWDRKRMTLLARALLHLDKNGKLSEKMRGELVDIALGVMSGPEVMDESPHAQEP